jgi:DNA-binding response OmpR family regulator
MSPPSATILVVDDELTVLDTVKDGLTAHGYQVLTYRALASIT